MTPTAERRSGRVTEFDEQVGLGVIAGPAEAGAGAGGPREYPFHCTQIADGSRTIPVGTPVTFDVRPGRSGRWEAFGITPTSVGPEADAARSDPVSRRPATDPSRAPRR